VVIGAGVDQLTYHGPNGHSDSKISVNFLTGQVIHGASSGLYLTHSILMFFAWGVIIPLGMLFARYFRHLPDTLWFKVHLVMQPFGYLIAIIAIIALIIAIIMVGSAQFTTVWHGQFGLAIMVVGFFQVIIAIFRPHKEPGDHPTLVRQYFEYSHWWVALLVLAVVVREVQNCVSPIEMLTPVFKVYKNDKVKEIAVAVPPL